MREVTLNIYYLERRNNMTDDYYISLLVYLIFIDGFNLL